MPSSHRTSSSSSLATFLMASRLASCSLRVRSLLTTLERSTSVGGEEEREEKEEVSRVAREEVARWRREEAAEGVRREVEERWGRGEARDQVARQVARWEILYTWSIC